ncbi:SDR family NAD(P)-dependent oxidoreductase [Paenibacillus mendelii]|uniref:SDR family NAD(P)-dependent oxidoreductase n=1 Tax=Paenibacillus mendelii TaxID=206163 RepID=A0ABV6JFB3_9BACL|nr:SDR family NAD(P)-dependent oxidoreductase [Paenibacillus mendelii]MCQ6557432.1 SDR family oxidoreductase [Paenibacillus mendelii]
MEFQSKVALVTGAGNGIGKSIAGALARDGATVIAVDIDGEAADRTAQEIVGQGRKAFAYTADVSQKGEVKQLVLQIKEVYGSIDVLINNVGLTIRKPIVDFTEDEWDYVFNTNLKSLYFFAKEAGRIMLANKSGAVVNISSIHALGGIPRRLPYSVSKAAVDSFTRTLACEWALDGIRVNTVTPGYILTDGLKLAFDTGALNQEDMVRRTPLGHLGTPENIADAALFLCSSRAEFITGTTLYVDGGYSAYHGPERLPYNL